MTRHQIRRRSPLASILPPWAQARDSRRRYVSRRCVRSVSPRVRAVEEFPVPASTLCRLVQRAAASVPRRQWAQARASTAAAVCCPISFRAVCLFACCVARYSFLTRTHAHVQRLALRPPAPVSTLCHRRSVRSRRNDPPRPWAQARASTTVCALWR